MASTAAGASLTEQHRLSQMAIRAEVTRQFFKVWPIWSGDEATFQRLLAIAFPLISAFHTASSSVAASYYEAFRTAEDIDGEAMPRLALSLDELQVRGTLHRTGVEMTNDALLAGQSPQEAMNTALVRISGTVGRFSLQGGRETIVNSSRADRKASGYARVTSDTPCAFCALLASRGPVYHEDTVDFAAHDHCSCAGEVYYAGSEWPGRGKEFRDIYNRAIREARAEGDLERDTTNDALNAFRRALSA